MFQKCLIANRGEIAVRIIRTCRELGIPSVSLYQAADRNSLHVRLADESVELRSALGFHDRQAILAIAQRLRVNAIHPGYGFLAENRAFIQECTQRGIHFIGPPPQVFASLQNKISALAIAKEAGYAVPEHSPCEFYEESLADILPEAERIGYPLVVKSCAGGRGRGERMVWSQARLLQAARQAQAESRVVYGDSGIYLEKAILPSVQIGVQVMGDAAGHCIHLGEVAATYVSGNQKILIESPAPQLDAVQRQHVLDTALALARLFKVENLVSVEFLLSPDGSFYFTEIKPRIQIGHPVTEMVSRLDLVEKQFSLAAGKPLGVSQADVPLTGCSMQVRISAEDPARGFLPNPGTFQHVRLPDGPGVRSDTYVYSGCPVPEGYDPLVAKLIVWAADRQSCGERLRRCLRETRFSGLNTNLPFVQQIVDEIRFDAPIAATGRGFFGRKEYANGNPIDLSLSPQATDQEYRHLAVAAAIHYLQQSERFQPTIPERLNSHWVRESRRLGE